MDFKEFKEAINNLHFDDSQDVEFDEFGSVIFICKDKSSEAFGEKVSLREMIY